jgi:hypothetical protein
MNSILGFKQKQEEKAAIALIAVFYIVFIFYGLFLIGTGLYKILLMKERNGSCNYGYR